MRFRRNDISPKKPRRLKHWDCQTVDNRGRPFNRQAQAFVYRLHKWFSAEKVRGFPSLPIQQVRLRTSKALKVCPRKVTEIVRRGDLGLKFLTPGKVRARAKLMRDIDETTKRKIREIVYDFASQRRSVTVADIHKVIREKDIEFKGKRDTLRKVLHDLGFKHQTRNGHQYVIEGDYIKSRRHKFLRQYVKYRNEGERDLVFQDETFAFRYGSGKTKDWRDNSIKSCSMKSIREGERYVIVHAGSKEGFVDGGGLFFSCNRKPKPDEDYHSEMNADVFFDYMKSKLLPGLKRRSVIIFDNAPYHSRQLMKRPTTNWKKAELVKWLQDNFSISCDPAMLKGEIFTLCSTLKPPPAYEIDEFVSTTTPHVILRLPPYHFFYNPIELVWGIAKRYFDKHVGRNNDFSKEMTEVIWREALDQITPQVWANCYGKIDKRIMSDYAREIAAENQPDEYEGCRLFADENNSSEVPNASTRGVAKGPARKLFDAPQVPNEELSDDDLASPLDEGIPTSNGTNHGIHESFNSFMDEDETNAAVFNIPGFESTNDCDGSPPEKEPNSNSDHPPAFTKSSQSTHNHNFDSSSQSPSPEQSHPFEQNCDSYVDAPVSSDVKAWLAKPPDTLISAIIEDLKVRDLRTLLPLVWLNDCIINTYLSLIVKRSGNASYSFDTFFMEKLRNSSVGDRYKGVRKRTKKVDIFSKKLIFIPIHLIAHWCLCVVNTAECSITCYDSLGGLHDDIMRIIFQYLQSEHEAKKKVQLNVLEWSMVNAHNIPRQTNGSDCGVFTCTYAEFLSRNAVLNFSADDMPGFRWRMMEEIVSLQLHFPLATDNRGQGPEEMSNNYSINELRFPMKKLQTENELKSDVDKVLIHQSASFSQRDERRFPKTANTQCTAIATYCIAAFTLGDGTITRQLLDTILIEGDKYYSVSKLRQPTVHHHLGVEDLWPSVTVSGRSVNLKFDVCGQGDFPTRDYHPNPIADVTGRITSLIEAYNQEVNDCGFLFMACSKTVAFFIWPPESGSERYRFLLFNSHSVDLNNRFTPNNRRGKARVFRCMNAESLAKLLLTECRYGEKGGSWQIYQVNLL